MADIFWIPQDLSRASPAVAAAIGTEEPPPPPPVPFKCWPETEPAHQPLQKTIPSYLYVQYNDDDALQAFVAAYNSMTQDYVDAFLGLNLPIYPKLAGKLLDWVAAGLYGFPTRPTLVSGHLPVLGTYNTLAYDTEAYNFFGYAGALVYSPVSDDIFHRIITWHFYKGDGFQFDIRWLKRRIARFLFGGQDCLDPNIDQTYQISVFFGPGNIVYIQLIQALYAWSPVSIYNTFAYNTEPYDVEGVVVGHLTPIALAKTFIDCVNGGFLELPFQFQFIVQTTV